MKTIWIALLHHFAHRSVLAYLAYSVLLPINASAQPAPPDQTPAQLAAQFRQIKSALETDPSSGPAEVSEHWTVVTSEGRYSISSEPLRSMLGANRLPAARQWLDRMAAELEANSSPPEASTAAARAHLDGILGRREFSSVHPPSAWDMFRDRLAARIALFLQRLFGSAAQHIGAAEIVFWILIVAAIGFIAMGLIRLWRSTDPLLALPPVQPGIILRDSVTWLREARQAAAQGQWREAIHAAYWAGIARLHENRTLAEDRTRTPREYLSLIPDGQAEGSPLRALTGSLERFWYAKQAAAAIDFDQSLKYLEALGCRLD